MILVLDTAALWHTPLLEALAEAQRLDLMPVTVEAVLPAVAFAERLHQVHGGAHADAFRRIVRKSGLRIEPFTSAEAERLDVPIPEDRWRPHARDYLIAAHVHGDRVGVTPDHGPAWLGRPVRTPPEATAVVRSILAANT